MDSRRRCTECEFVREERAAVYEYDGGLSRAEAERRSANLTCEFDRKLAKTPEAAGKAPESDDLSEVDRAVAPEKKRSGERQGSLFETGG